MAPNSLDESSVITIEDYQQNLEVVYIKNPNSMAYSSNKLTVAIYPTCIEYESEGSLKKGAIGFISDGKIHNYQQVWAFKIRAFEIILEQLSGDVIRSWQHWVDGCISQFKLGFTNVEQEEAEETFQLDYASSAYFESHERKNLSDTIGSIMKYTFVKKMNTYNKDICCMEDVIKLVKQQIKERMDKFKFFIVEELGSVIQIPLKEQYGGLPGMQR